jgi:hypothetical protein
VPDLDRRDDSAGRLRARIDLDPMLARGGDVAPILEDDREREHSEDCRSALLEQDSGPRHPTGGERLPVSIENKRMHRIGSSEGAPPLAGEKFASAMLG